MWVGVGVRVRECVCVCVCVCVLPPPPPPPPQLQGWWFLTFTGSEIKDRVHYLSGVQYLFDSINPDQIEIPQFVLDHDAKVTLIYTRHCTSAR